MQLHLQTEDFKSSLAFLVYVKKLHELLTTGSERTPVILLCNKVHPTL